jgi:hypothetical protein
MAAQMIESVQMSVCCTSKEIGLEDASDFKVTRHIKIFQTDYRIELVNESQLGEVQMKPT